jgi:sulfate adenylyltransferase
MYFLDDPYEEPADAEIVVDTTTQTIPEIVHSEYAYLLIQLSPF